MSVFKVKLQSTEQGLLDLDPSTGAQFATSKQRTIYVTGPGKTYRKLKDGDQFTDSNYWKRFAYPQVPLNEAFIEVVTDDGSVYSDVIAENTYPRVWTVTAAGGSTYAANVIDILGDTGSYASYVEISNQTNQKVKVKLNGLATGIFDLGANEVQVFNNGDLQVSKIEIDNTLSGAIAATIQALASIRSVSKS